MTLILPMLDLETAAAGLESSRLEDLISLEGLVASSDIRFDRYTELATTALELPMAALVLVDKDGLHIKSVRGVQSADTSRHESFAAHVVEELEILVINDAQADPRFANHPLVKSPPHVRFYAGAVIRGPSGHPLGAICVMDSATKEFSDKQRGILLQLANLIEHEIETLKTVGDLREKIQEHAFVDPISRLPTQELFLTRLAQWIKAEASGRIVVTLMRIDRYEAIYSAVGKAGAAYLVGEVVTRLREGIAATCLMGQLREDTIGLAFRAGEVEAEAAGLKNLLHSIRAPIRLGSHRIIVRGHVGVAVYPNDAANAETLVKRARTALHAQMPSDSAEYRHYSPELSADAARSFEIESALKGALERNELQLVFQPKVSLSRSRVVGVEALLRWNSATLGSVSPTEFIPIAEESGLIVELGAWVLENACRQLSTWNLAGFKLPEISVNISSFQLRQQEFCEHIESLLRSNSLAGAQLNLELT
ncbi:MAG TPA: EAL domain-containing protein, partial [Gammaproteobacteria bacterium]|nr:EAL domain-containing protein [Gammaproteobacteria bacterium]